jgi:serine/threonine protein kinase
MMLATKSSYILIFTMPASPFSSLFRNVTTLSIGVDEKYRAKLCTFSNICHRQCVSKSNLSDGVAEQFLSPEIAMSLEDYDCSSDIFSFGIVLSEIITGKEPSQTFLNRHKSNSFAVDIDELRNSIIDDCPDRLELLAYQCCEQDPSDRPKADTCVDEIEQILQELGINFDDLNADDIPTFKPSFSVQQKPATANASVFNSEQCKSQPKSLLNEQVNLSAVESSMSCEDLPAAETKER